MCLAYSRARSAVICNTLPLMRVCNSPEAYYIITDLPEKTDLSVITLSQMCIRDRDPVLIFGLGPFPAMRIMGAAVATVIAQAIVTLTFLIFTRKDTLIFPEVHFFGRPNLHYLTSIIKIGLPTSIQSMLFTGISMIIARLVAGYGDAAVAVQKVGSQIESCLLYTSH